MKKLLTAFKVFPVLILMLSIQTTQAGSATWNLSPGTNWNTNTNWTPNTVPNGPGDIATFDVSTITDITSAPGTGSIEVDSIVFNRRERLHHYCALVPGGV